MQLHRHASLRALNTFGIDARAEYLAPFRDVDQLRTLLAMPALQGMPRMILGGGSNVLFTRDFPGAVLLNEVPGIEVVVMTADVVQVQVGAGVGWHELVEHCVAQGWGGIENLSLIPGKVGAAPMQNIGAYGVELKDVFMSLDALRIEDGELLHFKRDDCAFGYRESFFKREGRDRFVIMGVTLKLRRRDHELRTEYGDIRAELARMGVTRPTIQDVSTAVIAIRRSKLPDPAVIGNAGSFFKNPVVPASLAERIRQHHPAMPAYPAGEGQVKLAAGWLIEQCGWKGHRAALPTGQVGGYGVHDRQALVLVNHGGAQGADIYDLSEQVLRSVREGFGVELEREVNVV